MNPTRFMKFFRPNTASKYLFGRGQAQRADTFEFQPNSTIPKKNTVTSLMLSGRN
jgi:hypothetical protein